MHQRRPLLRIPSSLTLLRFGFLLGLSTISFAVLFFCHDFAAHDIVDRHPLLLKKNEIAIGRHELHWTAESSSPQLWRNPFPLPKHDKVHEMMHHKKLWSHPSHRVFVQCVQPSNSYTAPNSSKGYLVVHTNGGLNQMRAGISDMVAVARIIDATLVIPELDKKSYWQDKSNFSDVFDDEHFIKSLSNHVKVVKTLPKAMRNAPRKQKTFKSWSGVYYYTHKISPLWKDYQVIRAAKSDTRLANNNLPVDIQKLRCHAFFHALRFSPKVEALGKLLVERMRSYGRYIALHLRYEKDILAFSGCTYGLSEVEANELTIIRQNTPHWKVKNIDSKKQMSQGYCPFTPKEAGMFLSALGYPSNTPIYIAAGEIYGGDIHMSDLKARFPILMYKERLATQDELKPFINHASQLAALDYIVSVESDVFVPSYSGNMARAVEGHRRFLGHRKTISPFRKGLVRLFDKIERGKLKSDSKLSELIIAIHRKRQGSPRKRKGPVPGTRGIKRLRSEETFYENPLPECLCLDENQSFSSANTSSRPEPFQKRLDSA